MWKFESSQAPNLEVVQKANSALDTLLHRADLGFKDPKHISQAVEACTAHAEKLRDLDSIVVIGVGGSSLGTKALAHALYPGLCDDRITFLDNVDAHSIDTFLQSMSHPKKVGWVLCSKSGSTIEVLSLYEYCHQQIKKSHNFLIKDNTWTVTESKSSPLYNFAHQHNIPQLEVPFSVGGRFSVLTSIGLLPLQILGFEGESALKGFEKALSDREVICAMVASLFECVSGDINNLYSFQYCDRLGLWSFWLQQLWSESLAKKTDRSGEEAAKVSAFIPCRGVSDQHSVLQQIIEGHEKKMVCFHRVRSSEKSLSVINQTLFPESLMAGKSVGELLGIQLEATEQAINESGSATFTLTTEELSEASMGYIMGLWMIVVGVLGEMLDINAFDQPGVESGKVIARRVLQKPD